MKQIIFCHGHWCPWIKVGSDLGLWRADGAVEVLEARRGILFHWEDHFLRLTESCKGYKDLNLQLLPSEEEILEKTKALLKKENFNEAIVHILMTPGESDDLKKSNGSPQLIIDVRRLERQQASAMKLVTKNARRYFPEYKLTAGYGYARRFLAEAESEGFDSFLYWDERDGILEAPHENIFFIDKDKKLITPAFGMLHGITRQIFLSLAEKHKIFSKVVERQVHLWEMPYMEEVVLSSTTKGGLPVTQMGDASQIKQINSYKHFKTGPDTYSARLKELFLRYREDYFAKREAA